MRAGGLDVFLVCLCLRHVSLIQPELGANRLTGRWSRAAADPWITPFSRESTVLFELFFFRPAGVSYTPRVGG